MRLACMDTWGDPVRIVFVDVPGDDWKAIESETVATLAAKAGCREICAFWPVREPDKPKRSKK